ncbi:hypothetical protein AMAG_00198 [Allomyces macrogynus ATCC 38327]|uniref:NmrA-like domain-containing protein n=1 Tax=Allomyces macrogynus (strain ATCC 38327) TaxID=578462 RepID=A0A0L0RVN2_ALLM3|nr:hypothetical protein AMAG_00198 [Allomyces macrogynus ATCC 38327]|eukprot:KNE54204.1 hypothetical protein AMAG_00198 [Allomyces macrogynus ATCC 38327]
MQDPSTSGTNPAIPTAAPTAGTGTTAAPLRTTSAGTSSSSAVDAPTASRAAPAIGSAYKTLLVTGATGTTGYEVLKQLTTEYRGRFRVVAGVHARGEEAADVLGDVDVIKRIDADDLRTLNFEGIDILFIIPSNAENRVEQVRNYVNAAKRDGVKYILLLSVVLSEARDNLFAIQFHDMERFVSDSGIPCTFLRCTFFMENLFAHADEVRLRSTISLPIGRGKCAPVSVVDVARAACAILNQATLHTRKAYDLVGPQLLDGPEIAAAASRGLGRPITYADCSRDQFLDLYERQGVPHFLAAGFGDILELVAANKLANLEIKTFFQDLTGHAPTTLDQFFREHADVFTAAPEEFERPKLPPRPAEADLERYGIARGGSDVDRLAEDVYLVLRDLVRDRHDAVMFKREALRREEARLNRLLDMYEYMTSLAAADRRRYREPVATPAVMRPRSGRDDDELRRYAEFEPYARGAEPMRGGGPAYATRGGYY